jgi:hypothetical protein
MNKQKSAFVPANLVSEGESQENKSIRVGAFVAIDLHKSGRSAKNNHI